MLEHSTQDQFGQNVKFSPHCFGRLACAAGANFGLSGKGSLQVIDFDATTRTTSLAISLEWQDVLTDVSWCPHNPDLLASSSGDGFVILWDVLSKNPRLVSSQEHARDVSSIDWNTKGEGTILTSSWDGTIKQWDSTSLRSVSTFIGHSELVYDAKWSPWDDKRFASASGDGSLFIWDSRHPPAVALQHGDDVLALDWSPTNCFHIATAAKDGLLRIWDIRNFAFPLTRSEENAFAARRVKYSHGGKRIVSVSYDFTTRIWNANDFSPVETMKHHTEFVYGLDVHPTLPHWVADCSWDKTVKIFETPQ